MKLSFVFVFAALAAASASDYPGTNDPDAGKSFLTIKDLKKRFNSIVVELEPPPRNAVLLDFDCDFAWMAGEARSATTNFAPGVFVYSKSHDRWLQLLQVSTAGAKFGKSPPEARIQAPWDFTGLAAQTFVALPINSGGAMHYPDGVTLDPTRDAFVVGLDSKWKLDGRTIETARTTLLIPRKDLIEAFDYYSKRKSGTPDRQGAASGRQPVSSETNRASAAARH